jgi:hypothetical protein
VPVAGNYAFVTSAKRMPAQIGGLTGGDAWCNELAAAVPLPGTYVAWLSAMGFDAETRVRATNARGWSRPDGMPFADTIDDIVAGNVLYPLRLDETGSDVSTVFDERIATGTIATGADAFGSIAPGSPHHRRWRRRWAAWSTPAAGRGPTSAMCRAGSRRGSTASASIARPRQRQCRQTSALRAIITCQRSRRPGSSSAARPPPRVVACIHLEAPTCPGMVGAPAPEARRHCAPLDVLDDAALGQVAGPRSRRCSSLRVAQRSSQAPSCF